MTARLVLATANAGKAAELGRLLGDLPYEIRSLRDYPGVVLPPETGTTYRENARIKARAAAAATGAVALGDDSGLEVDALGGRPGVETARYGGPGLSDAARVDRLLAEIAGTPTRAARFRCVLALVAPWGDEAIVEGTARGRLASAPRGQEGFGYDPIFLPEEGQGTFAELPPPDKDRLSHRGRAATAARPVLLAWSARAAGWARTA